MRHLRFVVAVAGISLLSNLGLEIAAAKFKSPGLAKLAAATHKGSA